MFRIEEEAVMKILSEAQAAKSSREAIKSTKKEIEKLTKQRSKYSGAKRREIDKIIADARNWIRETEALLKK
jgi:prefoldin subunit 5